MTLTEEERKLMAILVVAPECDQNSGSPLAPYVHLSTDKENKMKHTVLPSDNVSSEKTCEVPFGSSQVRCD